MRFSPPPLLCYHIAMKDFPHHFYRITTLVSHLTCPLPPHQSVIPHHCMRFSPPPSPCHCITASLHHCVTALPHHCMRFSPPPLPCYHIAMKDFPHHLYHITALVSHLTCPLASLREIFPTLITMLPC